MKIHPSPSEGFVSKLLCSALGSLGLVSFRNQEKSTWKAILWSFFASDTSSDSMLPPGFTIRPISWMSCIEFGECGQSAIHRWDTILRTTLRKVLFLPSLLWCVWPIKISYPYWGVLPYAWQKTSFSSSQRNLPLANCNGDRWRHWTWLKNGSTLTSMSWMISQEEIVITDCTAYAVTRTLLFVYFTCY